jgi:hypothetical protein
MNEYKYGNKTYDEEEGDPSCDGGDMNPPLWDGGDMNPPYFMR